METIIPLSELKEFEVGLIVELRLNQRDVRRLEEIGITKGNKLLYIQTTIFHDPLLFEIDDTLIAIRLHDAKQIFVERVIK